jgi:hypothetical protein
MLAASLAGARAQDVQQPAPAPAPAPAPDTGWKTLSQPRLIVNDELMTSFEVNVAVQREARLTKKPIQSLSDFQQRASMEIADRARQMLQVQGGKDLGFDPALVDRLVNNFLNEQKEDAGSLSRLAEELAREEKDSFTRRDEVYSYVYGALWVESEIGKSPGPGGRNTADRYVRPGRGWFEYRERLSHLEREREVQLRQLILAIGKTGGPDAVRIRLDELRNRVLAGEDMGELAERYGATEPGTRGATGFLPLSALQRTSQEVYAFTVNAKVGDVSEVLPLNHDGKLSAFIVVRLEESRLPEVPAFEDREAQARLFEDAQRTRDRVRINRGLSKLFEAAYVWPPEAAAQDTPSRQNP